MSMHAETDARLQVLYRQKGVLFERMMTMAESGAQIIAAELAAVLRDFKSVDDEINALTEEMFFTIITDLRP